MSKVEKVMLSKNKKEDTKVMKGYKVIGIGAAGNKATLDLLESGLVDIDQVVLVNSTKKDIPSTYTGAYVGLSPSDSGCGKERNVAKEYAVRTMKSGVIDQYIGDDITSILIISSIEGGTGSGAAPIIGEYCVKVLAKNVHIIAFTGFEEDVRGLSNSIEFFQELDFDCDVQCIRNSAFLTLSGGNKFKAEQAANRELVERIRIISGADMIASTQNIDDTDLFKIVNTTGYKTVDKITFNEDIVDQSAFDRLCKNMIYNSKSLKTENPGQIRLGVILNISPASEDAIDYNFGVIKEAYGVPYETFTHAQWDGKKQYIAFISSGMKLPINELKAIYERYVNMTQHVDKDNDKFFDEVSKFGKDASDSRFDMVRGTTGKKPSAEAKSNFFKQFETKPTE